MEKGHASRRALRALLSMRRSVYAARQLLILRSVA
jgi:hypothetical protein